MGFFGDIIGLTIDTATLPVDVIKDTKNFMEAGDEESEIIAKLEKIEQGLRNL